MRIGYALSCEEFGPRALIDQARCAEAAGFHALCISDHFHPWNSAQGHSPFVWTVIGALAQVSALPLATAVSCPTTRLHPAILAQAAATAGVLVEGGLSLGVGAGWALNERVLGDPWPSPEERLARLEEAVWLLRRLWSGEPVTHRGRYYTVVDARVYDLPERSPEIFMLGDSDAAVELAARIADGLIVRGPDSGAVHRYRAAGGRGPVRASLKICFGAESKAAWATVLRLWRHEGLPGDVAEHLATPAQFDQARSLAPSERVMIPAGPDMDEHEEFVRAYAQAGIDDLFVQQIGADHDRFFADWAPEILDRFSEPASHSGRL
jgi:G6PDH family F420-dependent oxidoreductase